MKLSSNKSSVLLSTAGILIFLGLVIPAYLYSEIQQLSIIRDVAYVICCISSVWVLSNSILSKTKQLAFFSHLFLFFTLLISVHLIIAAAYGVEGAIGDIIGTSYCWFALALGTNLNQISKYKSFQFLIYLLWCCICYFVFTSLDPVSLQAVYGKEDPMFSGAYQYIGDIFAVISILLIFQQLKSILDQARNQRLSVGMAFLMLITWIASNVILFLNSSRASFYSFLILTFYLIHVLYISYLSNHYIRSNIVKLLLLVLGMGLIVFLYLLLHGELMANLTWDTVLLNRNLELLTEDKSSSLEDRGSFNVDGFQDILNNPVFGSYIHRVTNRGPGTYMHNIMEIMQDFGIPAFASFLGLISSCMGYFLKSYKHSQDYETMVFNTLLIFALIQLLFFRNPLGFYAIYINFGIVIRRQLCPEILGNRGHYSQRRLTGS